MLYFTRWKALAIVLTALVVCLCAVPNFFPEAKVKTWPAWAQRHLVLGLDLQGGSYLLLEVDSNYIKKEKLDQVRDEARRVLREARIGYTGLVSKPDSVEVRVKDTDSRTRLLNCASFRSRSAVCLARTASAASMSAMAAAA